ncbi:hypothetical protein Tco_0064939 [Tanacetum coccineum]
MGTLRLLASIYGVNKEGSVTLQMELRSLISYVVIVLTGSYKEAMDSQSTQTIKLPILQPQNGNAPIVTKTVDGKETVFPPTSVEEKVISATADEVPTSTEVNTASAPFTTVGVSVSTVEPITTASTLVTMRSEKAKVRGVVMQETTKTATRPTVPPQQHDSKDKEKGKMIVPNDEDDLTIDVTPLSIKIPIVDYKIYQEGKKSFFQIIRADGKNQMYLTFSKMLKNFDREDLEVLWKIVKARFKMIEPVNYMDIFLHLNLKTMFEYHVEDNIWKNQQGLVKVQNWKLFYSCGVHCVTVQSIPYYLLVEKMYPLTKHTIHQMFNDVKLQVDYECEMAFDLLRLVKKQLKEGYIPG